MKLLAAGFNAHRQLISREGNVINFELIDDDVRDVLLATWSSTTIETATSFVTTGHQAWSHMMNTSLRLKSAVGNHNGLLAALDEDGSLLSISSDGLSSFVSKRPPSLSHLAMTSTGRIALIHSQTFTNNLTHMEEFVSFDALRQWYSDPSAPGLRPAGRHTVSGRVKQLLAGASTFAMLMQDGTVLTWGDARHRSLGREIDQNGAQADEPGVVDGLLGLSISKIALGSFLGGALSEDGALYLWGSSMPGKDQRISCLDEIEAGEQLALVQLPDDPDVDMADLAIGDGHAALLTSQGKVYVVGENKHGQLGLGAGSPEFMPDWTPVTLDQRVKKLVCGPKATFLLLDT